MATKQDTIRNAQSTMRRRPARRLFMYRVGAAWMFTGHTEAEVQAQYKAKVQEYQPVPTERQNP